MFRRSQNSKSQALTATHQVIRAAPAKQSPQLGSPEFSMLPTFKKALEEYDKKYTTLIDYFGVIGPPIDQIYSAIESAKHNDLLKLTPCVLSRVPEIDKPSIAFPSMITEFSVPLPMRVLSKQEVELGKLGSQFRF
jgi:hypothetical protein